MFQFYQDLKLGISTYSLPWAFGIYSAVHKSKLPNEILQVAIDNDIKYFQFGDNLPLHHFPKNEIKDFAAYAKEAGIKLELGTRRLTEENLIEYLGIAKELNAPFLRVVIDDENFHPSEEEVTICIKNVLPLFQRENISLAIENHDRFTSQVLERIIKETDPLIVGICLDTANSLGALEGPYETIKNLAPYTINLHIKDISIARLSHKMGFTIEGCAAGDGMLNIPWIIEHVNKYGKCKTATLEIWSSPDNTIEQTIINEKILFNKSLQYLKQYFND